MAITGTSGWKCSFKPSTDKITTNGRPMSGLLCIWLIAKYFGFTSRSSLCKVLVMQPFHDSLIVPNPCLFSKFIFCLTSLLKVSWNCQAMYGILELEVAMMQLLIIGLQKGKMRCLPQYFTCYMRRMSLSNWYFFLLCCYLPNVIAQNTMSRVMTYQKMASLDEKKNS